MTRSEAMDLGLKQYCTGKPCKHGHVCNRQTVNGTCVKCCRVMGLRSRKKVGSRHHATYQAARKAARRAGGAQYEKEKDRRKRARKVGGSQHENHLRYHRKGGSQYLAVRLRSRFHKALRGKFKAGSAIRDLGCSIAYFKAYIAQQFTEGMTWDNYGEWHLDHKRPLAAFDLTSREDWLRAAHYTNYQPLWAEDNHTKNAKLDWERAA